MSKSNNTMIVAKDHDDVLCDLSQKAKITRSVEDLDEQFRELERLLKEIDELNKNLNKTKLYSRSMCDTVLSKSVKQLLSGDFIVHLIKSFIGVLNQKEMCSRLSADKS